MKEIYVVIYDNVIVLDMIYGTKEEAVNHADLDADLYEHDRNLYKIVKYAPVNLDGPCV